jgi:hypothetical protein
MARASGFLFPPFFLFFCFVVDAFTSIHEFAHTMLTTFGDDSTVRSGTKTLRQAVVMILVCLSIFSSSFVFSLW